MKNITPHYFKIYSADEDTNVSVLLIDHKQYEKGFSQADYMFQGTELDEELEMYGLTEVRNGLYESQVKASVNHIRRIMQTFGFSEIL